MKSFFLTTMTILLLTAAASAADVMRYRRYTTSDGLLQNNATTFAQDKYGYLWIGSRSGLCRFDGSRFESYNVTADGRKIGWVRKIRVDSDGSTLLMKINNQKFVRFDPRKRTLTELKDKLNLGIQAPPPDVLAYTAAGLRIRHRGEEYTISYSGKSITDPFHCENFIDRQGNIWANFDNSVYQISFSDIDFDIYNKVVAKGSTSTMGDVRCIARLRDGTLIIGTKDRELMRYTAEGSYMACLNKEGQWQEEKTEFLETAYNVAEDAHGRLWIGMRTNGVACLDKAFTPAQKLYHYTHACTPVIPSDQVFDIHLSEKTGLLWIGTWGCGLSVIDTRKPDLHLDNVKDAMLALEHNGMTQVRRICELGDTMAVCTTTGLYLYARNGRLVSHIGDIDISGAIRSGGRLYVGAYSQGAFVADNGKLMPLEIPGLGDCIHTVSKCMDGQLLFINPDRMVLYDTKRGSTRFFDNLYFGRNISFSEGEPLFIGTTVYAGLGSGMLVMDMKNDKPTCTPTIHIRENGATIGIGSTIDIRPMVGDFRLPRMVSYAWREKGDSLWHYIAGGNGEISLSWFMPGAHTVEFCSTDAMGIWTNNVTEACFFVVPSWWQWAMITFVLLAITVMTYLGYKANRPELIITSDTAVDTAPDIFPSPPDVTPYERQLAQKLVDCVERSMSDPDCGVEQLAKDMGMNRSQLYAHCKDTLDKTPAAFILEIRMKRAMQLIETHQLRISEVAYKIGFTDPKYFAKVFRKRVGVSPSQYAEQRD